jgi:hypothetical protein
MESCHEYLGCHKTDCVMFQEPDKHCWEIEGTLCHSREFEIVRSENAGQKINACAVCIYHQAANQRKQ